jgi:hypothetical protein
VKRQRAPRARAFRFGALAAAAYASAAVPVAAQSLQGLDLTWDAPSECPQLAAVRARVDEIAGASVQRSSGLRADARVVKEQGRYRLKLVVRDGALTGQRSIASDSCEHLAGAAAVALGLLLRSEEPLTHSSLGEPDTSQSSQSTATSEPTATAQPTGTSEPTQTSQPTATSAAAAADEPVPAVEYEAPRMRHWRFHLRIPSLVAELGPLPQPSLGLAAGAGIGSGDWRVSLLARVWRNQAVSGVDLPAQGADLTHQTAMLTVGRGFRRGELEAAPFVSLALERITARGTGAGVVPSEQEALWLGVGAGVEGRLHISDTLAAIVELGCRAQTSRPVITIDGLGRIRKLGAFAVGSALGFEWTF